jgi:hypothetical protein
MDSEEIQEITPGRHLKYGWISLMFFLIAPCLYLFLLLNGKYVPFTMILIMWGMLGLFYVTGFILHISYYQNDRYKKISFNDSQVTIIDRTNSYSFRVDEIDSIINHRSGLHNRAPWNEYEFTEFKLRDGKKFIVTCLLLDLGTISEKFPEKILIKKNHFIASLPPTMHISHAGKV